MAPVADRDLKDGAGRQEHSLEHGLPETKYQFKKGGTCAITLDQPLRRNNFALSRFYFSADLLFRVSVFFLL